MSFERILRYCFVQQILYADIEKYTGHLEGADVCKELSRTDDCSGLSKAWGDGITYNDNVTVSFYSDIILWGIGFTGPFGPTKLTSYARNYFGLSETFLDYDISIITNFRFISITYQMNLKIWAAF